MDMAPIICRVVGPSHFGISGVHIALACKDECMNVIARFFAFTDLQGTAQSWFPDQSDPRVTSVTEPRFVDTLQYPRMHLTFFSGPYSPLIPWTDIQAEMHLCDDTYHGVILYLDPQSSSYQIRHTAQFEMITGSTIARPERNTDMMDGVELTDVGGKTNILTLTEMWLDRTPSPLWLPSPQVPVHLSGKIKRGPGHREN